MKVDLEILSTKNIESQEEINNAFRKNHNTTNLLLTVNYLLKEKEYDKALQYLKDKR
jgi:sensor histidine kinase regulating citrate/malate metabolism